LNKRGPASPSSLQSFSLSIRATLDNGPWVGQFEP